MKKRKKEDFHHLLWTKGLSLLPQPVQLNCHRYIYACPFSPLKLTFQRLVYMKLNLGFSLCCIYLDNVKFFDGMDDDGSELNLHFICLVYLAFVVTVLYLNSPRLKLMIVNGECFFRYSKECTIQQEP